MKLHYYTDPQHGWIKVSNILLSKLGLTIDMFSSCSYIKYNKDKYNMFLEEDIDAPILLSKLNEKNIPFTIITHHTNRKSKIRNYQHV